MLSCAVLLGVSKLFYLSAVITAPTTTTPVSPQKLQKLCFICFGLLVTWVIWSCRSEVYLHDFSFYINKYLFLRRLWPRGMSDLCGCWLVSLVDRNIQKPISGLVMQIYTRQVEVSVALPIPGIYYRNFDDLLFSLFTPHHRPDLQSLAWSLSGWFIVLLAACCCSINYKTAAPPFLWWLVPVLLLNSRSNKLCLLLETFYGRRGSLSLTRLKDALHCLMTAK